RMQQDRIQQGKMGKILCTAVLLAGGRSSRMGFDKQLLEKNHKRLSICLAEELLKAFREVLVVTNTPELYQELPVKTCSDIYPGQGPVSGMHSAFCHCGADRIFVMACDMPGFCAEYARYQAERMQKEQTEACVTMRGEKMEPFHGFYSRSLLKDMEARLVQRKTSVFKLLQTHAVTRIDEEEMRRYVAPEKLFCNLNTPQDYEIYAKSTEES
ncbi:MAG: molybdenum cofactor guanylyltransferase, partial [Lachnospiraceae bacterium]|nr:molybdenum cofactor guanylyltransferase [Lachnospiraceae bacterium]